MTFCEEITSHQIAETQRLHLSGSVQEIFQNALRRIYKDEDGFEFWNFKYADFSDYDNVIVLPDGHVTDNFADIVAQRGAISQ